MTPSHSERLETQISTCTDTRTQSILDPEKNEKNRYAGDGVQLDFDDCL